MFTYGYLTSSNPVGGGRYVEVLEDRLKELLRPMIEKIEIDEPWYEATYGDVAEAVRNGDFDTAKRHYIIAGYFENRLPRPVKVDEKWYLHEYGDVADAVANGTFLSGQQHFMMVGFREGRRPFQGWSLLGS